MTATLTKDEEKVLEKLLARHPPKTVIGERDWNKLRALNDPSFFVEYYFPHRIRNMKDFHRRFIKAVTLERNVLVLLPAQHGKSTLASELIPIYELCRNPNIRIILVAKNDVDVSGRVRSIRRELEGNQRLIEDFGKFQPPGNDPTKPWAIQEFTIAQRTENYPQPTLAAFGSKANILGKRSDLTICDDVVTEKNSATPEQREKMKEWFDAEVETGPEQPFGRISVVGTRFHLNDLYADLEHRKDDEGKNIYHTLYYDVMVDEERKKVLWPEAWDYAALMRKKASIGTLTFNKRYRNIARDESLNAFKEEYIRGSRSLELPGCLDRHRSIGQWDQDRGMKLFQGFDPAIGSSRRAKFCGGLVLGVSNQDEEEVYYVIDVVRRQLTAPQQVNWIVSTHMEYGCFATVIETNSYQLALEQFVNDKIEKEGLPALTIAPHVTGKNKLDPEAGIFSLSTLVENGRIRIPYGNPESRRKSEMLIEEMLDFPQGEYSDILMALWFAILAAKKYSKRMECSNLFEKRTVSSRIISKQFNPKRWIKNPFYD